MSYSNPRFRKSCHYASTALHLTFPLDVSAEPKELVSELPGEWADWGHSDTTPTPPRLTRSNSDTDISYRSRRGHPCLLGKEEVKCSGVAESQLQLFGATTLTIKCDPFASWVIPPWLRPYSWRCYLYCRLKS